MIGYNLHRMRQLPRPVGDEPLRPERESGPGRARDGLPGCWASAAGDLRADAAGRRFLCGRRSPPPRDDSFCVDDRMRSTKTSRLRHGSKSASPAVTAMLIPTAIGSYFGGRLTHVLSAILRATFVLFSAVTTSCSPRSSVKTPRDTRAIVQNVAAGGGRAGGGREANDPPGESVGFSGVRAQGGSGKPNDPPEAGLIFLVVKPASFLSPSSSLGIWVSLRPIGFSCGGCR